MVGGVAWVASFVSLGYHFGNLAVVKKNFTLVIIAIVFLSVLPGIIEYVKARRADALPEVEKPLA